MLLTCRYDDDYSDLGRPWLLEDRREKRGGGRWGEMSEETTWKMEENEGEMRGGNGREII